MTSPPTSVPAILPIPDTAQSKWKMLLDLDEPIEIDGIGVVGDDLWEGALLRKLRS
jgi:hypothetical protein